MATIELPWPLPSLVQPERPSKLPMPSLSQRRYPAFFDDLEGLGVQIQTVA